MPIPIEASYGVPFLVEGGPGVSAVEPGMVAPGPGGRAGRPGGALPLGGRAGPGPVRGRPRRLPDPGPHRLALAARVRVVGLTDAWELELPHIPFSFEFDPILAVEALLTRRRRPRAEAFARSIRLDAPPEPTTRPRLPRPRRRPGPPRPARPGRRHPPALRPGPRAWPSSSRASPAGSAPARWSSAARTRARAPATRRFPIGPILGLPPGAIDRPGERRIRAVLTADPDLGWADPDVRSLWPGTLTTDWATVRVIRK